MHQAQHQPLNVPSSADIRALMARRGFAVCDEPESISTFREFAQSLISVPIATTEVMAGVQARTRASLFLRWENEKPTGFIAFFPFSAVGEQVLESGAFVGTGRNAHRLRLVLWGQQPGRWPCGRARRQDRTRAMLSPIGRICARRHG
jgi:hypothetical protein